MEESMFMFQIGKKFIWVYGLGKILQFFTVVPRPIRHHLADFAFVPAVGFGLIYFATKYKMAKGINIFTKKEMLGWVTFVFVGAVASELIQGLIGHADIWDIGCYFAGYLICLFFYKIDPGIQWFIMVPTETQSQLGEPPTSAPAKSVGSTRPTRRKPTKRAKR